MKTLLKSALSLLTVGIGLLAAATTAYSDTFPANLAGTYYVPIAANASGAAPRGSLVLSVTESGSSTGTITLSNGKTYGFKVTLTGDGDDGVAGRIVVTKGKIPMPGPQALEFPAGIRLYSNGTLQGGVSTSLLGLPPPVLTLAANQTVRLATFSKASPAPWSDTAYTMAMTPAEGSTSTTPAGAGYATLTVLPTGDLTAKMVLGDGTKITAKAKPTADAKYRLFSGLYTPGGYFSSEIDLDDLSSQADAVWNKPANASDKKYKDGFNAVLVVKVAEWLKLSSIKIPVGFTNSKNFAVDFSGEGLSDAEFATNLPDTARFTGSGSVQAVAGGMTAPAENNSKEWNKLWIAVKVNPVTGEFSGSQKLVSTGKTIPVAGVILPSASITAAPFAYGQYRVTPVGGAEISGLVTFSGPLEDNLAVASSGTYVTYGLLAMPDANRPLLSSKPLLPAGSPVVTYKTSLENSSERAGVGKITIVVAEDLQSVTVNKVKLTFQSKVGGLYTFSSLGIHSRVLYLGTDPTTGNVTGYIYTHLHALTGRTATFTCDPVAADDDTDAFTSITKL